MRKNVKKQLALRVLSTAALVAMVSSIATAAFADTYDLNKGSVTVETKDDGFTYVTQLDNTQKDGYARNDKDDILHDYQDKTGVTITSGGEKTSNTITVDTAKDQTTDVTLQDVNIEVNTTEAKSGAIEIKGDGDTNLELNGDNTVLVKNEWSEEHAAIEKADKYGKEGTLTIKDDLNDDGSEKKGTDADTTGKLLAGGYQNGAGIGGGSGEFADTSNITITGGEITASGGHYGAGVGSGNGGDASNIRIEGNAHVTAFADGGAAIGAGEHGSSDVTITDHATVDAAGRCGAAIGLGNTGYETTITISGNATVNAEGVDCTGAIGSGRSGASEVTVNIKDNANVTAIADGVAIGNNSGWSGSSTTISITGGTVDAVAHFFNSKPAIGTFNGNLDLTINSSTGETTVNAYTTSSDPLSLSIGTSHYDSSSRKYSTSPSEGAEYNEDGSSNLGESNAAIINSYRNTTLSTGTYNAPKTLDDGAFQSTYEVQGTPYNAKHILSDKGDLYKVVHNRKYMDENPNIDTKKLEDEDLHDWKLVGKVVEPTTEKDGYADYICSIDKCGQTKHVVLPKIVPDTPSTPETPDTPDTPNTPSTPDTPSTPSTPDTPDTPSTPVTPDAPVQDAVPDTAPADAAVTPAAAQNVVQDAKPEAAATAAVSAAALPQTGANWLAVVGSALSGLFLLAAGFVLDRKGRRMN